MAIAEKIVVLVVAAILCAVVGGSDLEYNYIRGDPLGPERWSELFPQCGGEANSPIDLTVLSVDYRTTRRFNFTGWDQPRTYSIENEGSTVTFKLNEEGTVRMEGGGLDHTYDFVQFHFHWGSESGVGSEHTVHGKSYPAELHLVHKRSDFNSLTDALNSGDPDALAVLGFLVKIGGGEGNSLSEIIAGSTAANRQNVDRLQLPSLSQMFGMARGLFWRYQGSVTVPSCNEKVVWTVFTTPILMTEYQLDELRGIDDKGYGAERYRPVQPLGTRRLTLYLPRK